MPTLAPQPAMRSSASRRGWIAGGLAGLGLASLATLLYRTAPTFWRQYFRELRRPVAPPPLHPRRGLANGPSASVKLLGHKPTAFSPGVSATNSISYDLR